MSDPTIEDMSETAQPHADAAKRDVARAMWQSWRRRCPACGTGPLMKGYLTTRDTCAVCGADLRHTCTNNRPATMTFLVVGLLMAPALGATYALWHPDPMVLSAVFAIGTVALSLWLLPRFKGLMIGFQWARRMNGFAPEDAPKGEPDHAR